MTSEKNSLGIIPIVYIFLSGSANTEQESSMGQSTNNVEDILESTIAENECE